MSEERVARMKPETLKELARRIRAAGAGARLEIREDDAFGLHFRVLAKDAIEGAAAVGVADLNEVWWCPPTCL